jgi:hypothetical protein
MSQPTPTKKQKSSKIPEAATEFFVYRCLKPTETGMARELVGAFVIKSSLNTVLYHAGPGRYRVEYRDEKRAILKVSLWVVYSDGQVKRGVPLKKKRKVGPAKFVPDDRRP